MPAQAHEHRPRDTWQSYFRPRRAENNPCDGKCGYLFRTRRGRLRGETGWHGRFAGPESSDKVRWIRTADARTCPAMPEPTPCGSVVAWNTPENPGTHFAGKLIHPLDGRKIPIQPAIPGPETARPRYQLAGIPPRLVQRGSVTPWLSDDAILGWRARRSVSRSARCWNFCRACRCRTIQRFSVGRRACRAAGPGAIQPGSSGRGQHRSDGIWRGRVDGSPTRIFQTPQVAPSCIWAWMKPRA